MSVIGFVPVRAGSKGIPGKNIKSFCGKPLVFWVLDALERAPSVDRVVLATDGEEIAAVASSFDFAKLSIYDRDPRNASDHASTESVMLEVLGKAGLPDEDLLLLVQATTPYTRPDDFEAALSRLHLSGADSLLSCARQHRFVWSEEGHPLNYDVFARPRRQDFNGLLVENGAFYINRIAHILRDRNRLSGTIAIHEMPAWSAWEIDEPEDWPIAEQLMHTHVLSAGPT